MRAWKPGDYPIWPFICLAVRNEAGLLRESAHLMTDVEIDHFLDRIIFELKVLPKQAEQSREAAKRELTHQQARMLNRA